MNYRIWLIILPILSYFFGNINWALIISKIKKNDIRNLGSGNPGTLNMSRNFGLKTGLFTFFLDILKGAIPTLVAFFVFKGEKFLNSDFYVSDFAIFLCGFSAVVGHIFPIFLRFKGGKGIASTIGVMLVCSSVFGLAWLTVFIMALIVAGLFIYFTEFGAMGSFLAITPPAVGCCIRMYIFYGDFLKNTVNGIYHTVTCLIIFAICFLTWFAHRQNIKRMLAGDEHPTSIKEMIVKHKAKKLSEKK